MERVSVDHPSVATFFDTFNAMVYRAQFKDKDNLADSLTEDLKKLMVEYNYLKQPSGCLSPLSIGLSPTSTSGLSSHEDGLPSLLDSFQPWGIHDTWNGILSPPSGLLSLKTGEEKKVAANSVGKSVVREALPVNNLNYDVINMRGQYVNLIRSETLSLLCKHTFGCPDGECEKVHIDRKAVCETFFHHKVCDKPDNACAKIHLKWCHHGNNCLNVNCGFMHNSNCTGVQIYNE